MIKACHVISACPQCGGEVVFDQEATGTRCHYCGAGLQVLGGRSAWLNFLIKPRIQVKDTGREVTRIAMKNGWRPTHLRSVIPFFYPFYRTSGHALLWVRGLRRAQWDQIDNLVEKMMTRWVDLMRPAHSDVSCGLFSPGVRAQTLQLHLATRENAGRYPFLPIQVDRSTYLREAQEDFFGGLGAGDLRVVEEKRFRIWERHSVLFFPLALLEVREAHRLRLLLLDMVSGDLIRQMDSIEMEGLLDNLGIKGDRSPGEGRLKLVPLICPECAGDLSDDVSAVVRFCLACSRGWEARQGRLREREWSWSEPPADGGDSENVFLPFWKRGADGQERFLPAFGVRSPQMLYNLSRRYYEAGFRSSPVPVDRRHEIRPLSPHLPADQADEMAAVVLQTSNVRRPPRGGRLSLVVIPFRRRGTDLVDVVHGLAVPIATLGVKL